MLYESQCFRNQEMFCCSRDEKSFYSLLFLVQDIESDLFLRKQKYNHCPWKSKICMIVCLCVCVCVHEKGRDRRRGVRGVVRAHECIQKLN